MAIAIHPYAELFPMLSDADGAALRADIASSGQRERVILLDGMVLDGRNRQRQLEALGLVDGEVPVEGSELWISRYRRFNPVQDGDALAFVLSLNLHRRHLSEGQRAMVAASLANMGQGARTDVAANSDQPSANLPKVSQADAAEMLHVSARSVTAATRVRDHGAPELVDAVNRGDVAVSAAADLSSLSVGEQLRILRENNPREFRSAFKEARREQQDIKKVRRQEREADLGARQAALPSKRFGVVLADPEWQFKAYSADTGMDRAADNHYPTSTVDVIAARPVGDIAADDSVLLLWVTVPMLLQGLEVMAAWGFTYKSHFVWAKDRIGTGYWNRNQHELLLIGTRGNVPAPAMGDQWPSLLASPVGKHSAKPPFAHEIAEAYFPSLLKIELNARERRVGWDAWGFEVPEEVHATSEAIAISKAEALEIITARYTGDNGQQLADELGRPLATIRKWAWEAGVSSQARSAARGAAHLVEYNREKAK